MKRLLLFFLVVVGQYCFAQTWQRQNGPAGGTVTDIEFDNTNSKVYALVSNRLYISSDDGANWTKVTGTLANYFLYDIEIGSGTIYVTDGYDVFTSTDGTTWTKKNTDFVLSSVQEIKRYGTSSLVAVATNRVYYSTNGGTTWATGAAPSAGSWNVNSLAVNNVDQIFLTNTSTNLPLRSTDGGISFSAPTNLVGITPLVGPVYHMTSNNSKSLIYIVTALDIYSSTNGASWTSIKSGIADLTISNSTSTPSLLEFSADGLGMYFVDNVNFKAWSKTLAAGSWTQTTAFPGTNQTVNAVSAKNYASAASSVAAFGTNPGLYKTTNGGSTINESNSGLNGISTYQFVHAGNGTMLLNTNSVGLYQSTDQGINWSRQTNIPTTVSWISATSTSPTTGLNHVQLALLGIPPYTFYTSTNAGTAWTAQTTPAQLAWMQGTDYDHVFGVGTDGTSFYYSYSSGSTASWRPTAITITGLPAGYGIYSFDRMSVYSSSATSATMFFELYNGSVPAYEQWKIVFTIGATTTISGVASKITTIPISNIDEMVAVNGKFYVFSDNTSPDQYAYSSNSGSTWTTRSCPGNGEMFVARNGYVFVTTSSPKKVYMSRDDGLNFIDTTIPTTIEPFNINNIVIDLYDYGLILSYSEFVHRTSGVIVTPLAPTTATIVGKTANAISIRWDDNATNEDKYNIERSSDGGVNFVLVGSVDGSDICDGVAPYQGYYVDGGLTASTAYIYRVYAVNDAGSSSKLTFASTTTLAGSVASIPDNRSWTAANAGGNGYAATSLPTIGIRSLGGNKYEVSDMGMRLFSGSDYKDTFYESNGTTLVAPTNTSFNIVNNGTGTWNGTNSLTLKWKHCSSGNFETITYTLNSLATEPTPAAPSGVQALITGTSQIEISWTSGFYEKDYIVERSPDGTTGFVQVGSNINYPTTKTTDNSALVDGTTYYYRVRSRNANNVSSANSVVTSIAYRKPYFILPTNTINSASMVSVGAYWADYNSDGKEDVLFIKDPFSTYGVPVIYESDGLGNFISHQVSVSTEMYIVASVADFNNDGFPDLAMSIDEKSQLDLYYGNGDFTFTKLNSTQLGEIATGVTTAMLSTTWADINNDGRLDLIALPNENGTPFLFKQTNTGSFVKIAGGDLATNVCSCVTPLVADYNADGYADLLITSSNGAWSLFQNNQNETFTNRTAFAGIDASQGFAAAWGDFNTDGLLDLYAAIGPGIGPQAIYRNNGNGTFTKDVSSSVSEATYSYGGVWGDFNNDGLLDLVAPSLFTYPTRLFINTTSGSTPTFTKITNEKVNDINVSHYGGGTGDFDNDGYLDLMLSSFTFGSGDPLASTGNAFKNNRNLATSGNWLKVKLVGVSQNRSGVGAQILVTAGGKTQVREVFALSSFASQNSTVQHFGLGNAATVTTVQIRWPSGALQTLSNQTINQLLVITEDITPPGITLLSPTHNSTGINANTTIEITLNESTTAVGGKNVVVTAVSGGATVATLPVTGATKIGNKYTFTVPAVLAQSTQYEVTINSGAFVDTYNNAFAGVAAGAWRFTTKAGPQIVSLTPAHVATGVGAATTISIDLDVATTAVGGKKLFLYKSSDLVNPVATVDASSAVLSTNKQTFTLPALLLQQTNYTVVVEAGSFKDVNQNAFAGIAAGSWTFTTAAGPQIVTLTPSNGSTAISAYTTLVIDLNTTTTAVSGKKLFVYKSSDLTNPVVTLDASAAVLAANKQTFTLPSPLQQQTSYTVVVEAGAFKDSNQNVFAGIASGGWVFTTAAGPQIVSLTPSNNAVGVSGSTTLAVDFNVLTTPVAGKKLFVYKSTDLSTALMSVDVSAAIASGNRHTFTLPSALPPETTFNVAIEAGSFKDASDNFFAGLDQSSWKFTTIAGPKVSVLLPLNSATAVASNTQLAITLDKSVTAVVGKKIRLFKVGVAGSVFDAEVNTATVVGNKFTYTVSPKLETQTNYSVVIDGGSFTDVDGNSFGGIGPGQWTFTTNSGPAPTTLVPSSGATAVTTNAPLVLTLNRNVTAVAGKKLTVLNGASLVYEVDVSVTGSVSNATYTLPAKSAGWPYQTTLTILLETGAFVDVNLNDASGISGTTWQFTTVDAPDTEAPSINAASLPTVADKGALPTKLEVSITDNKGVTSAKLSFRPISGSTFSDVIVNTPPASGNIWSFTINPSTAFDANGLQFFFTATDAANNTVRSPATGYHKLLVKYSGTSNAQVPQSQIGSGGTKEDWKVIAVPFVLGSGNAVASVFEELASNSTMTVKKDWRLLILKQTPAPNGSWGDYPEDFTTIQRGVGYFVNVKNASPNLIIGDNLQAPPNTRDNLFELELKSGWNMIGNPYLTPIDWSNVVDLNGLTGTAITFKKFSGGAYSNTGSISPYEGGFVQVAANTTIKIPFLGQTSSAGRRKDIVFGEGEWLLPITLKQDGISNTFGGVGMHKDAGDYFDELDDTNGPRFFDFLEMNISHPDHFPYQFARDVISPSDEHTWEFFVSASGTQNVEMSWDPSVISNRSGDFFLFDADMHVAVDMKKESGYRFDPAQSKGFKILFGRNAWNKVVSETPWLGQPYPNPSKGISYIPFALPEGNDQYAVRIEIFDMMGRHVTTVVNGSYTAGAYTSQWMVEQSPVSNGLYTVRMTVNDGTNQKVFSNKVLFNK